MARVVQVRPPDADRITGRLFLTEGDRRRNLSAFWVLLGLSAVIASAGVVAESTATVIGAMIVAPLMTPILGVAVSLVLADHRQLVASAALVVGGGLLVVLVGFVLGLLVPTDMVAATNDQVAGRVSPRLIDLVAALATGLVGAFALVRDDVSDTLPGVAIAISLVPPLAVVGLTAEASAWEESAGALLLFATNVAAIVATGTVLLLASGLRDAAAAAGRPVGTVRSRTTWVVAGVVLLLALPLGVSSRRVAGDERILSRALPVVHAWADTEEVSVDDGTLRVVVVAPRLPDVARLRAALDDAGLDEVTVVLQHLVGTSQRVLPRSP